MPGVARGMSSSRFSPPPSPPSHLELMTNLVDSLDFLMVSYGSLWFLRAPWGFLGFHRVPKCSLGFLRISTSSLGFL